MILPLRNLIRQQYPVYFMARCMKKRGWRREESERPLILRRFLGRKIYRLRARASFLPAARQMRLPAIKRAMS
jgi:hypothetical protein